MLHSVGLGWNPKHSRPTWVVSHVKKGRQGPGEDEGQTVEERRCSFMGF